MPVFTPSFECRSLPTRWHMGAAWFGCVMLSACAQTVAPAAMNSAENTPMKPTAARAATLATTPAATLAAAQQISAITLESDCMGCRTGQRMELHRDGRAVATSTGKARLGTADHVARATLPEADFDALAQQLLAGGFFEMAPAYEEAGLQDGNWSTLTVQRSGSVHQVFRREDAGPPALKVWETTITALQKRLVFVPDTP